MPMPAIYTTILTNDKDEAKKLIPPLREGFKRIAESLEEFDPTQSCYRFRLQILDKQERQS